MKQLSIVKFKDRWKKCNFFTTILLFLGKKKLDPIFNRSFIGWSMFGWKTITKSNARWRGKLNQCDLDQDINFILWSAGTKFQLQRYLYIIASFSIKIDDVTNKTLLELKVRDFNNSFFLGEFISWIFSSIVLF